jgi:hypothetical protein
VEAQLLELDALRNEFSSREVFEARHSRGRAQQAAELTIGGKMSRNEGTSAQLSGKQLQCSKTTPLALVAADGH